MAVERVGMAIAIWVICAVLLVVVIILAIYLFCCLRRRRQRVCDADDVEEDETHHSRHEAYLADNRTAALHVHSDAEEMSDVYRDYKRAGVQDLMCNPAPGVYQAAELLVQLTSYVGTSAGGRVDILVNVLRQDASIPDARYTHSPFSLLGNLYDQPGFFSDDFLLYTAPLYFTVPGRYVVQAYTVNTRAKIVGSVHQFVFVLSAGGAGQVAGGSAQGPRSIDVTVDQQSGAVVPYGAWNAGAPSPASTNQSASAAAAATLVPYSSVTRDRSGNGGISDAPLPPRIEPSRGTVTTTTRIVISPDPQSAGGDYIRYSVDGSYPSLTYTGPFTLSLPPASVLPERQLAVCVKAVCVSAASAQNRTATGTTTAAVASPVVEATLTVRPAGYSYYDPALPTPTVRVRTQGAKLYFDETNNPVRTCTCYQIVSLEDARRHKVRFNRKKCEVYKGQPIPLLETIAMVYAWTVDEAALVAGADANDDEEEDGGVNDPFTPFSPISRPGDARRRGTREGAVARIRSVATIYNCSRSSTEHGQVSRKRVPEGASLLPPPVLCISCDEVEVEFDEPPAHSLIAYTLNNKEPALLDVSPPACAVSIPSPGSGTARLTSSSKRSKPTAPGRQGRGGGRGDDIVEGDVDGHGTFIYETGKPIHVTQLESDGVYITARLFAPVYEAAGGDVVGDAGAQGGTASAGGAHLGYRYGDAFHRGFFFQANQ